MVRFDSYASIFDFVLAIDLFSFFSFFDRAFICAVIERNDDEAAAAAAHWKTSLFNNNKKTIEFSQKHVPINGQCSSSCSFRILLNVILYGQSDSFHVRRWLLFRCCFDFQENRILISIESQTKNI